MPNHLTYYHKVTGKHRFPRPVAYLLLGLLLVLLLTGCDGNKHQDAAAHLDGQTVIDAEGCAFTLVKANPGINSTLYATLNRGGSMAPCPLLQGPK